MAKRYEVRFRLEHADYEQIKQEAHIDGNKTLAAYFRKRIVSSLKIEQYIIENNKILKRLEQHILTKKTKTHQY